MAPQAVHFGAGNIGRGFIGALLSQSGYDVTFADIATPLINALNERHSYTLHILDVSAKPGETEQITNVSGVMSNDSKALTAALVNADLVTTAVGPAVLKIIARSIAAGVSARRQEGKQHLNIIACENMTRASAHLGDEVEKYLTTPEDKAYFSTYIGFPNCAVDRIVPPYDGSSQDVLAVGVEAFHEWIVEEPAFKGSPPDISGWKLTDNLVAYVQRKLFTLNCGHAACAYLGYLKGIPTVDQSLKDSRIESIVRGAMSEAGAGLCRKHGFDPEQHAVYIEKIMNRFRNPHIRDEVERVGRDPLRKLGPADRLVGPTKMAREFGLETNNLLKAIAAAMWYDNSNDPQSVEMREKIHVLGLDGFIEEVLGWGEGSEEAGLVKETYEEICKWKA